MQNLLLIGLGGFMGALLRYGVSGFIQSWSKSINFPYGTLVVNLLGCLLIGMLSQVAEVRGVISPEARSFIFSGLQLFPLLGTILSAFSEMVITCFLSSILVCTWYWAYPRSGLANL